MARTTDESAENLLPAFINIHDRQGSTDGLPFGGSGTVVYPSEGVCYPTGQELIVDT